MGPLRHFLAMENVHIAIAVLVTAVATAGIAWYFGREQRGRRAIGAAPIVKVRDVKPGMTVRVTGSHLVLGEDAGPVRASDDPELYSESQT